MGWMRYMYYMIYDALSWMDRQKEGGMIAGVLFIRSDCLFSYLDLVSSSFRVLHSAFSLL